MRWKTPTGGGPVIAGYRPVQDFLQALSDELSEEGEIFRHTRSECQNRLFGDRRERVMLLSPEEYVSSLLADAGFPQVTLGESQVDYHFYERDMYEQELKRPFDALHVELAYAPTQAYLVLDRLAKFPLALTEDLSTGLSDDAFLIVMRLADPEKIDQSLESALVGITQLVDHYNEAARSANYRLRVELSELVEKRQQKFAHFDRALRAAAQRLSVRLSRDPDPPTVNLEVSQELEIIRNLPNKPASPELSRATFMAILDELKKLVRQFEVAPLAYRQLSEPDFRHIILAVLNTIFRTNGTAEAFSNRGKTDIYLAIQGAEVLVAECKLWEGMKYHLDALQQLFGYLQWSQNFGLLLVFNKKDSLTGLVRQSYEALRQQSTALPDQGCVLDERHHTTTHRHPVDEQKSIEVHTIFINLRASTEASEQAKP